MRKTLLLAFVLSFSASLFAQEYRLVWPKNNYVSDTNAITFQWSAIDGATSYDLQYSHDPAFPPSANLLSGLTSTSYQAPPLQYGTTYYWRIRTGGTQTWSYYYKFNVFEPTQFTGLSLWFEANRNVTTSGGSVTQWVDQSPTGAIAAAGSAAPSFNPGVSFLKNKPVVYFSGGNSNPPYMTFGPPVALDAHAGQPGFTFLCVRNYAYNGVVPANFLQYILGGSGDANGFFSEAVYYTGASGWGAYTTLGQHNGIYATPPSQIVPTFSIYAIQPDLLARNSIPAPQGTTTVDNAANNANASFLLNTLGRHNNSSGPVLSFKGNIAEMMVYNTVLDSASRELAEQYLRFKYAYPANLGPDTIFPTFCINATLTPGPGYFTRRLWSTGDTTATITIHSIGKYWIETTDLFGYKSFDTINVRPQIFFNQLPPTAFFCGGDSLVWNTGYPSNGFTFTWSNGLATPAVAIKAPGTYTVTISDNANPGCQLVSNPVVVGVDNFPAYTLGNFPGDDSDTSFCAGNRLNFVYPDSLASIIWSTGDTTPETVITTAGIYSVRAVNGNGCFAEDTIHVGIKGIAPAVGFINPILCANDTLQFTDTTSPPNGVPLSSWTWDFGDGATDTLWNPTHVYAAPGTYNISLIVTTDSGCVNSFVKTVPGYLKPVTNFLSKISCVGSQTQFIDQSSTTLPATLMLYKWNFGSLDSSILKNPIYSFPAQGKYEVTLKVTNTNGCVSTARDSVEVFAEFNADLSFTNLCQGDSVTFKDATPSYSIVSWLWQTRDNNNNYFGSTKNYKFKYSTPGKHEVSLQVQNAIGCIDKVSDTVTVYRKPVAAFENGISCEDRYYTPVDNSVVVEQNNTWKWNIAGNNYTGQAPQHFFADSGLYGVSLLLTSQNGCRDTANGAVRVSPNPIADFTFTPLYGDAPLLATFDNQSQHASSYIWTFGDGVSDNTAEPTHTYTTNDTFDIKLVAINSAGCTDSMTRSLIATLTELDISVDRVFTTKKPLPDGTVLVSVIADLSNQGTRLITTVQLYATIGSGGVISEVWDTLFEAGKSKRYIFKADFVVAAASSNTYVCVEATSVNNDETETRLDNNSACTSLTDVIQLIGPSPNPARGEANLGMILPKAGKVTIEIIDVIGQPVQDMVELDLPAGRSDMALPVKLLLAGEYFIRIKHNDDKLIRKLVVH